MTMHLNLTRFRKIVALARSKPHVACQHDEREQEAAWGQAERMAADVGLSLTEALSKLDAQDGCTPHARPSPESPPRNPFSDFFRETAEKRQAASRMDWPEHPYEARLRESLVGHVVEGLAGFSDTLHPSTVDAIRCAIPWPATMSAAVSELSIWNELERKRQRTAEHYGLGDGPAIRRFFLRDMLEGEAKTPDDIRARATWAAVSNLDSYELQRFMGIIAADVRKMFDLLSEAQSGQTSDPPSVSPTRQTNREKRERVRSILSEPGGDVLSLREIARRAGVSVQGAANIKTAMATEAVKD